MLGIYIIKGVFNQYTLCINEVMLKDIYYYIGIIMDCSYAWEFVSYG
jgi:hypothetical protein